MEIDTEIIKFYYIAVATVLKTRRRGRTPAVELLPPQPLAITQMVASIKKDFVEGIKGLGKHLEVRESID